MADVAAVSPKGIKTFLVVLSKFPYNGNALFSNDPKSLPKNPPGCHILCSWDFNNFILDDEPFAKALRSFETCVWVDNELCGKLSLSPLKSPTTFDEIFKATSVPFFLAKLVSFAYSIMKMSNLLLLPLRFPVVIIVCW